MPGLPLDKREVRIRRMFSQVAPRYDFLNHLLSLNIDRSWRNRTAQLVPAQGTAPILDLCTGTGDLALTYHRRTRGQVPIIGADFCHEMLVRAAGKTHRAGATTQIDFVEADAQHLPFPDHCFQLVTIAFGLRNVTNLLQGLREMIRVTRPGGRIAILEFSRPTQPILARLYLWYFRTVLPGIGQFFARNSESAYQYLPASVLQFPDGERMAELLRQELLQNVRYFPLTFGIATLYVGEKPVQEPATG